MEDILFFKERQVHTPDLNCSWDVIVSPALVSLHFALSHSVLHLKSYPINSPGTAPPALQCQASLPLAQQSSMHSEVSDRSMATFRFHHLKFVPTKVDSSRNSRPGSSTRGCRDKRFPDSLHRIQQNNQGWQGPSPASCSKHDTVNTLFPVTESSALITGKPQPCWLPQKQTHTNFTVLRVSFIHLFIRMGRIWKYSRPSFSIISIPCKPNDFRVEFPQL